MPQKSAQRAVADPDASSSMVRYPKDDFPAASLRKRFIAPHAS